MENFSFCAVSVTLFKLKIDVASEFSYKYDSKAKWDM